MRPLTSPAASTSRPAPRHRRTPVSMSPRAATSGLGQRAQTVCWRLIRTRTYGSACHQREYRRKRASALYPSDGNGQCLYPLHRSRQFCRALLSDVRRRRHPERLLRLSELQVPQHRRDRLVDGWVFQYCGHASHDDYQLNGRLGASRHHPQQLRHLQRDREQRLCGEG